MIRRGGLQDAPFLRALLPHAYHWRVTEGDFEIPLSRYVDRWGRMGDTAVIAVEDGRPVGAAWFRLYPEGAPGYGFVDAHTPELTIAVVPTMRGRGIGKQLVEALFERARQGGYTQISLNTRHDPGQEAFYQRYGFEPVREDDGAVTMLARL